MLLYFILFYFDFEQVECSCRAMRSSPGLTNSNQAPMHRGAASAEPAGQAFPTTADTLGSGEPPGALRAPMVWRARGPRLRQAWLCCVVPTSWAVLTQQDSPSARVQVAGGCAHEEPA